MRDRRRAVGGVIEHHAFADNCAGLCDADQDVPAMHAVKQINFALEDHAEPLSRSRLAEQNVPGFIADRVAAPEQAGELVRLHTDAFRGLSNRLGI